MCGGSRPEGPKTQSRPCRCRTSPSIGRFQSRSLSSAEALCGDEIFQIRPLPIGRDMPSARTQAPRIVHRIPVVKPAILRQGLRLVAGIDVRTEVVSMRCCPRRTPQWLQKWSSPIRRPSSPQESHRRSSTPSSAGSRQTSIGRRLGLLSNCSRP